MTRKIQIVPNRQKQTENFWDNVGEYEIYYSEINIEEIYAVSIEFLKNKMESFLKMGIKVEITEEVKKLAKIYLQEDLIPEKYENDALLLALTTVHSLDILVSWNFKHLVKRKTRLGVNLINLKQGYRSIEILAPQEL